MGYIEAGKGQGGSRAREGAGVWGHCSCPSFISIFSGLRTGLGGLEGVSKACIQ